MEEEEEEEASHAHARVMASRLQAALQQHPTFVAQVSNAAHDLQVTPAAAIEAFERLRRVGTTSYDGPPDCATQ